MSLQFSNGRSANSIKWNPNSMHSYREPNPFLQFLKPDSLLGSATGKQQQGICPRPSKENGGSFEQWAIAEVFWNFSAVIQDGKVKLPSSFRKPWFLCRTRASKSSHFHQSSVYPVVNVTGCSVCLSWMFWSTRVLEREKTPLTGIWQQNVIDK